MSGSIKQPQFPTGGDAIHHSKARYRLKQALIQCNSEADGIVRMGEGKGVPVLRVWG